MGLPLPELLPPLPPPGLLGVGWGLKVRGAVVGPIDPEGVGDGMGVTEMKTFGLAVGEGDTELPVLTPPLSPLELPTVLLPEPLTVPPEGRLGPDDETTAPESDGPGHPVKPMAPAASTARIRTEFAKPARLRVPTTTPLPLCLESPTSSHILPNVAAKHHREKRPTWSV